MRSPRQKTFKGGDDEALSSRICEGYQPSEGCPPLSDHWGGGSLSGSPWLTKFAESVAENPAAAEAWRTLEQRMRKDDLCWLIDLLYLYTVNEDTYMEKSCERHQVLKVALDSIVPGYDALIEMLSELIKSDNARQARIHNSFDEDLRFLAAGRKHAEEMREEAIVRGSKKARTRDWYLHLMVREMECATGTQQLPVLIDLINCACTANDEESDTFSEDTLEKRVRRYRKRYGLRQALRPVPYPLSLSKEELMEIEAQALVDAQEYYDSEDYRNSGQSCETPRPPPSDDDIPF